MTVLHARLGLMAVVLAAAFTAWAQGADSGSPQPLDPPAVAVAVASPAVQLLAGFRDSDVKFDVNMLMRLLRDPDHEGWVLAAYPDPKTGQPLIGAGVSIELSAREHPQLDPLNPNQFVEAASVDVWQAAGLEPQRLNQILDDFHGKMTLWGDMHEYRRHVDDLPPQITDGEATQLLRTAVVQSILNARAYCRSFDQLTASQQMALSQLVFQIGFNLQEFTQFLGLVNSDSIAAPIGRKVAASDVQYWGSVQKSLIQSQWARLYRPRAISVIAMLDPRYSQNPRIAERRVGAVLRPAVVHRRHGRSGAATNLASGSKHAGKKTAHARRRKA